VGTEGAPGHLGEIKPLIDHLFEFRAPLVLLGLAFQLVVVEDRQELVNALTNLLARPCRGGQQNRLHQQQNSQPNGWQRFRQSNH
jgi:hypothetical protein